MTDYASLVARLEDQNIPLDLFMFNDAIDAIKALQAERDALRADAMRYRWLRDFDRTQQRIPWLVRQGLYPNETIWWSFGLDNAIDAAMAAPPVVD